MYSPSWGDKESKNYEEENDEICNFELYDSEIVEENEHLVDPDSKFDFVMKCFGHPHHSCKTRKQDKLPDYIQVNLPSCENVNFQLF